MYHHHWRLTRRRKGFERQMNEDLLDGQVVDRW
jgi:hypothetical protein